MVSEKITKVTGETTMAIEKINKVTENINKVIENITKVIEKIKKVIEKINKVIEELTIRVENSRPLPVFSLVKKRCIFVLFPGPNCKLSQSAHLYSRIN